jgi:hypothetical protein
VKRTRYLARYVGLGRKLGGGSEQSADYTPIMIKFRPVVPFEDLSERCEDRIYLGN